MRDLSICHELNGLISSEVGEVLAELAAEVPAAQAIVEIGSYKGKSTAYLATGSRGAMVYAIDRWDLAGNADGRFGFNQPETFQAFKAQLARAGVTDGVIVIRDASVHAAREWKRNIGLLYVDGSHTEVDVEADWRAWSPHLAPGAVVVFDDYDTKPNPGVKRVVDRITGYRWKYSPVPLAIGRSR